MPSETSVWVVKIFTTSVKCWKGEAMNKKEQSEREEAVFDETYDKLMEAGCDGCVLYASDKDRGHFYARNVDGDTLMDLAEQCLGVLMKKATVEQRISLMVSFNRALASRWLVDLSGFDDESCGEEAVH
jgi:hypothetical protein